MDEPDPQLAAVFVRHVVDDDGDDDNATATDKRVCENENEVSHSLEGLAVCVATTAKYGTRSAWYGTCGHCRVEATWLN
jgi:hypothetical protein